MFCKTCLMVIYSLSFYQEILYLLHFWRTVLLDIVFWVDSLFAAVWIYHPTHFRLTRFLLKNLLMVLQGWPCIWGILFSFAPLKIIFLSLTVDILIVCFIVEFFSFIPFGICWTSWVYVSFLPQIWEFFGIISFSKFSCPHFPLLLRLITCIVVHLMLLYKSFRFYLLCFIYFSFCSSNWIISNDMSLNSLIPSAWSYISMVEPL